MFRMVYVRVVFTVYIDELLQRLVANLVGTLGRHSCLCVSECEVFASEFDIPYNR